MKTDRSKLYEHKKAFDEFYGSLNYAPSWKTWITEKWGKSELKYKLTYFRRNKEILSTVSKYLVKERETTILDLGCGLGDVIRLLLPLRATYNLKIIGSDISRTQIEYCKRNLRENLDDVKLIVSPAEDIRVADKHIDIVIFADVVEHVLDISASLLEINRVLKDDGIVILTTPNPLNKSVSKLLRFMRIDKLLNRMAKSTRRTAATPLKVKTEEIPKGTLISKLIGARFEILEYKRIEPKLIVIRLIDRLPKSLHPIFEKLLRFSERYLGAINSRQFIVAKKLV